jgi:PAS domain-containing protein
MFHPRADRQNQLYRRYRALRFAAMAAVRAYDDASAGILDLTMVYPAKSMQALARAALPYALALAAVATAYGLAHVFLYFNFPQPFAVLALCAIAVIFWCCGSGPGILATLAAAIVRTFLFVPEVSSLYRALYDLVFLVFALLMMQATKSRHELETRVAQRTTDLRSANEDLRREVADRVCAEEKLRQSESYLAEAQRLAHMGSWVWRVEGREAIHVSDEWYRVYGFNPEGGIPILEQRLERIHAEDRALWMRTTE